MNIDKQYQTLLQTILKHGVIKQDRTGTGTKSIFGYTIRHDMKTGFPLLTTKKIPFKTIVTELLWFLRGDTNIQFLVQNGCNIWNGDAYKNYVTKLSKVHSTHYSPMEMPAFVERIKTDDAFAKEFGDLGPIYGKQWRSWTEEREHIDGVSYFKYSNIDQIANLINDLKTNPDSRRLMVNAWNVGELDQMTLPPCHYGFQVYTRELSLSERTEYKKKRDGIARTFAPHTHQMLDNSNIPTRAVSLMWNQRSVDTFLGLPFNIASYALLLEIIAREVNMVPDELIGNLGDVHLYSNHIEQAKEQIGGPLDHEKRREMLEEAMGVEAYKRAVGELVPFGGGLSEYYASYEIPYNTREPYALPTLKIMDYDSTLSILESLEHWDLEDFVIENYKSHPAIKAPLSN